MKQELSQLSNDIVSSIILHNDLSKLTKEQQVQYVSYRCSKAGLDVAGSPFNLIPNKEGKLFLYANKEAAAQLNQLRSLSPVVSKEEFLMDNTIFKVTYKVTENGRATEDCGAVGLVKVKKMPGKPDEIRPLSPDEVADAIMKAHTKAKRRAILTHCGIGTNDLDEPLIVVDTAPVKEEIKEAKAEIKDTPKEEPKKENTWRGKVSDIRAMTAGRPIDIEVDGGVTSEVSGQLAAAGANAFVAGSAVFKGGTVDAYKTNISAIRNAAALARGEAI